jgi:hypothetical protein
MYLPLCAQLAKRAEKTLPDRPRQLRKSRDPALPMAPHNSVIPARDQPVE